MIEFKDWPKILNLLSALISQFLVHHGFSLCDNETIPSLDNIPIIDKEQSDSRRDLSGSFKDTLHIKSGGRKQYTFQDRELEGGLYNKEDSENNFEINGVITRDLNSEKLKTRSSVINSKLKAKVDRSRLRTSNFRKDNEIITDSRVVSWAKETFEKWTNPVFKSTEVPIPLLKVMTANNKASSVTSNFFSCNYSTRSNISEHRFCKKDIEQAEVIGQLDNKFIVCKLPCIQNIDQANEADEQKPRNILVLVDQHAADERIRVEMLFKEFCGFNQIDIGDKNNVRQATSFVETIRLKPSNKIILTYRETQVIGRFEGNFNKWGIFFSDKCEAKLDNINNTSFVSPHFVSPKDGDLIPIYITHLPRMIADRCALDTRITQQLVRQHLYWLEETGGIGTDFNTNDDSRPREWHTMIRKCPRGIIDILNSKACRGAIMFNDKLSLRQCKELIEKLAECDFPFQCAHGRPSMVPILYLNEARGSDSYEWKMIGIKSFANINSRETGNSRKRRKVNLERFQTTTHVQPVNK